MNACGGLGGTDCSGQVGTATITLDTPASGASVSIFGKLQVVSATNLAIDSFDCIAAAPAAAAAAAAMYVHRMLCYVRSNAMCNVHSLVQCIFGM